MDRLDKIISEMTGKSRREVKDLVKKAQVVVNGRLVSSSEMKVDPTKDVITVCGKILVYEEFTYLMLNKPDGLLTATEDSRQRTVLDLLTPELKKRDLAPVGRLDKDTEGLLILTNDGELTHRLLSPKYHVDKIYYAKVDASLEETDIQTFREGILLQDGLQCMPAELKILSPTECLVTVQEGKFHQVKRMLASCGKNVIYLKRLAMGELKLDDSLKKGEYRRLYPEEIMILKHAAGI